MRAPAMDRVPAHDPVRRRPPGPISSRRAPIRRGLSPILGRLATRTDVVFEPVLAACPELALIADEPDMAHGWFRRIILRRSH